MNNGVSRARWRLLLAPPRSGAENMGRDVALLDRARRTGECVFCVYSWARPTISFGRNQSALGHYSPDAIAAAGLDVVRRPTGGRSILHFHEATYSVTGPEQQAVTLQETYSRINEILVEGLRRLGVGASIAADAGARAPGPAACFAAPSRGELIARGGKLVGSAQWRNAGAFLQHGSILIEDDQPLLHQLSGARAEESPSAATLRSVLGYSPDVGTIAREMFSAVRDREDAGASTMDESEIRDAAIRESAKYAQTEWTWRR